MDAGHPLDSCVGFDWDDPNESKNWSRHGVTAQEAEEMFFREPLIVQSDLKHSKTERRYHALGTTAGGRRLMAALTIRKRLIRVISVRDMNRNEEAFYEIVEKATHSKIQ